MDTGVSITQNSQLSTQHLKRSEPVEKENDLSTLRHSTAHVMAHAVRNLFPDVKIAIGPSIEDGFYYDFDKKEPFTPEDLTAIEDEMRKIVKANSPFVRREITQAEALETFKDEPYKVELIEEIGDEVSSVYEEDGFVDWCRGPHVPSTGEIKAFKLLSIAGAYWRGDEKRPMLQRIYGTAWRTEEELQDYLTRLEESAKRDHRKLGRELELFSFDDEVGPGLVLWHPKGALIRKIIEDYWRDAHYEGGYELVQTPHIARQDLWARSGHLDFFAEGMYGPMDVEGQPFRIKPMNCPFHLAIYKSRIRSYRELPIRWAELGTVYRFERSGTLHGLIRVRGFTQDDAHIFCTPDQLEDEIIRVLNFVIQILRRFGFDEYGIYLSTMPEKHVGEEEIWEKATDALRASLEVRKLEYKVEEGGGAFYGPKIDIKIKDALGREHQCSTIQVDFNEPERFDITYIADDGKEHQPIMIHRALLGSIERFFGVLIEHYAGAFPLWLAPVQVLILPIADRHHDYAREVGKVLHAAGIRARVDDRNEKTGYKIREGQLQKVPYMLVLGDREMESNAVSVRTREEGDKGAIGLDQFVMFLREELEQ
ncbi:MAG: threonine--tRNA ligase [Armatimonadota bacterium]|nr:threonine--tRNA ligase [Armatimonadota bacterium]